MTNYGNRGMTHEGLIEFANTQYRRAGVAIIEKQHTHFIPLRDRTGKIVNCKVEEKATVDFMGRVRNTPIAIEAKHTSGERIRYEEVQDHQASFLSEFMLNEYGTSIVLVSFKLERFFAVPWPFWMEAREMWKNGEKYKRTITYKGQTWTTNGMASVKAEELLQDWEITMGGRYGLDYLWRYV